jgi:hypothetical protein
LILPSELLLAERIYIDGVLLTACTIDQFMMDNIPSNGYFASDTGECYINAELVDDDVVSIFGRWAITNLLALPDYWMDFFKYATLAYYFHFVDKNETTAMKYDEMKRSAFISAKAKGGQALVKPNFKNNILKG